MTLKLLDRPTFGPDASNWGGPLDQSVAACWKAHGQTFFIGLCEDEAILQGQLEAASRAGMTSLEAYIFLYWVRRWHGVTSGDTAAQVRLAMDMLDRIAIPVRRVWIDCEEDPNYATPGPSKVQAMIKAGVLEARQHGRPLGIYSNGWFRDHTNGWRAPELADLPFWYASQFATYIPTGPVDPHFPTDIGPWRQAHTWQYRGTAPLCGYTVDQNIRWFDDHQPEEAPMIRLNRISSWYDQPEHQIWGGVAIPDTRGVNARLDFADLPAEAVAVQAEIYLMPASADLEVHDGDEPGPGGAAAPFAFKVQRPSLYFAGRVNLSPDGWFHLQSAAGTRKVYIHEVAIVGYYLA